MSAPDHPLVKLFEARAELLDAANSADSIDEAVVQLAAWMASVELTEDDLAVLGHVGAILYREGLRRRMGQGPN